MSKLRCAGLSVLAVAAIVAPSAATAPATAPPVAQRIVSLSPTATEDLFAIGAGTQVVAVDDQSNYPAAAPRTKLSGYTPNAEAIAAYGPDLVVVSFNSNHIVEALRKLRIRVVSAPAAATLPDAYAQLLELGRATGHEADAARVVASMKRRVAAIAAAAPRTRPALTVYHELDPGLYSVTSKTFVGRVYSMLGLRNIADAADRTGSGYPQLSAEYVVSADPQLIVLADSACCGQSAVTVRKRVGWSTIAAVRKGGVVAVNDDIASRWGPRIVDFMQVVAATVRAVAAR